MSTLFLLPLLLFVFALFHPLPNSSFLTLLSFSCDTFPLILILLIIFFFSLIVSLFFFSYYLFFSLSVISSSFSSSSLACILFLFLSMSSLNNVFL